MSFLLMANIFLAFFIFINYLCILKNHLKMKKLFFTIIALAAIVSVKAQWVNNPSTNTFIVNTSADAGEIYTATNHNTGDTYVQWSSFVGGNGWSPTLQRLNFEGVPQWGNNGIHIAGHQFASYSQGFAMATTTDGGVVCCFAADDDHSYAVKINADGTFPWGEQGIQLFGGQGFSRVQALADNNGGFWTLGSTYEKLFLQYVNANGTTTPTVTIDDKTGLSCMFGQLTLSNDNRVFVTYEKLGSGMYTNKSIYVAGYNTDGTEFSPETLLMSEQVFQSTYIHSVIADGLGGGYVYIFHPAMYNFNVYVFHFNQNGVSTITDTNGTPVHSPDSDNLYVSANATVDPDSHDIILFYEQTDAAYQIQCKLYLNRITSYGARLWDDGILVLDNGTAPCGGYRIDAFEYGGGFSLIYHKGLAQTSVQSTVESAGYDMNHNVLWNTQLCSTPYNKTGDQNTPGFFRGQNISVWVNAQTGGLYGQNIGWDGSMGANIIPPTPPTPCYAPTNFQGEYAWTNEMYGPMLSWNAPEITPIHYNLYCEETKEVIEVDPEYTSYFLEKEPGDYIFRLTAVYDDCESNYALTADGDDYILIEVTSVPENETEAIVNITAIYNINGQILNTNNINELSNGIFIIKGVTDNGKTVIRKIVR